MNTTYRYDPLNTVTGGNLSRLVAACHGGNVFAVDDMGCLDAPDVFPAGSMVNPPDTDCVCPLYLART